MCIQISELLIDCSVALLPVLALFSTSISEPSVQTRFLHLPLTPPHTIYYWLTNWSQRRHRTRSTPPILCDESRAESAKTIYHAHSALKTVAAVRPIVAREAFCNTLTSDSYSYRESNNSGKEGETHVLCEMIVCDLSRGLRMIAWGCSGKMACFYIWSS